MVHNMHYTAARNAASRLINRQRWTLDQLYKYKFVNALSCPQTVTNTWSIVAPRRLATGLVYALCSIRFFAVNRHREPNSYLYNNEYIMTSTL